MEGNPILAAVVFAALAGGVGFALFTVLPDTYRAARIPVVIVAVLMGALNGWDKLGGSEPSVAEVEQQLLESTEIGAVATAFKQADPIAFSAYVEQIQAALSGGANQEAAKIQAAQNLRSAAEARLAARPLNDVVAYYQLMRDEFLELKTTSPATCRSLFFGDPNVRPVQPSSALTQRRFELYRRAFGPIGAPPTLMSDDELEAAMASLFATTAELVGEDADLLSLDADALGREARSCEVFAELFNQIAQSPDAARIFAGARQEAPQPT